MSKRPSLEGTSGSKFYIDNNNNNPQREREKEKGREKEMKNPFDAGIRNGLIPALLSRLKGDILGDLAFLFPLYVARAPRDASVTAVTRQPRLFYPP